MGRFGRRIPPEARAVVVVAACLRRFVPWAGHFRSRTHLRSPRAGIRPLTRGEELIWLLGTASAAPRPSRPLRYLPDASPAPPHSSLKSGHPCTGCGGAGSAPGGTRTPNLLIRSQTLCPIELQRRNLQFSPAFLGKPNLVVRMLGGLPKDHLAAPPDDRETYLQRAYRV